MEAGWEASCRSGKLRSGEGILPPALLMRSCVPSLPSGDAPPSRPRRRGFVLCASLFLPQSLRSSLCLQAGPPSPDLAYAGLSPKNGRFVGFVLRSQSHVLRSVLRL